jgi:hypothetical protein
MRIIPMAVALGLALAGPALAASTSAKMTGQEQNASGPSHHRSQSSKMHGSHPGGTLHKQQATSPGGGAQ